MFHYLQGQLEQYKSKLSKQVFEFEDKNGKLNDEISALKIKESAFQLEIVSLF